MRAVGLLLCLAGCADGLWTPRAESTCVGDCSAPPMGGLESRDASTGSPGACAGPDCRDDDLSDCPGGPCGAACIATDRIPSVCSSEHVRREFAPSGRWDATGCVHAYRDSFCPSGCLGASVWGARSGGAIRRRWRPARGHRKWRLIRTVASTWCTRRAASIGTDRIETGSGATRRMLLRRASP